MNVKFIIIDYVTGVGETPYMLQYADFHGKGMIFQNSHPITGIFFFIYILSQKCYGVSKLTECFFLFIL